MLREGIRYLLKVNANDYGQQAVNEVIATRLHQRLGWNNYVPYSLEWIVIDGKQFPCSLSPLFTSTELELVSAYQIIKDVKIPNDSSEYEGMIKEAAKYGLEEAAVRRQLEYTILTDFLLSNTDRHYNNFGFLYDPVQRKLVSMAPIYDTGNALFYNREIIPSGENVLDVTVSSFRKREVEMLALVSDSSLVDIGCLEDFPAEVEQLLREHTEMPKERAEKIAATIRQKIAYLRLFQQGKKIWKREQYW